MQQYLPIPPRVRFALYLVGLIGGLLVALALAEGWLDKAGAAFAAGIVALINGLAAGNTDTSADSQDPAGS